jgi:hypothetical protein
MNMPIQSTTGRVALVLATMLGLPAALAGQACASSPAPGTGIAVYGAGGYYSYDYTQNIEGPQYGAGVAIGLPGPVSLDFTGLARHTQSGAALYVGNAKAYVNVHVPALVTFCLTAGLGASRLSDSNSQTANTTFAAPVGLRFETGLDLGVIRIDPFLEPYVLFAQTSGTVFDIKTSSAAAGGGADAGLTVHAGPLMAGVTLRYTTISELVGPHPGGDRAVLVRLGLAF